MSDTSDNAKDKNAAPPGTSKGWLQRLLSRKSVSKDEAQAPLPITPAGIAKEITTDIALCKLNGAQPEEKAFTALATLNDTKSGTKAFAYQSIADKNEVRLIFPGRSSGIKGMGTPAENSTLAAVVRGRPSYQIAVVEEWMQKEVIPFLKKDPDRKVKIFGHSMGAGNAIMAKHLLDKNGIASEAMIIEPFAATQAARLIIGKDLEAAAATVATDVAKVAIHEMKVSDEVIKAAIEEAQTKVIKHLQKGITSIRSYPNTMAARHPVGTSLSNNKHFGEQAFFLTATPEHPSQEGMSRRDILSLPVKAYQVQQKMRLKGTLEDDEFNQAGHTLQTCRRVLEKFGDNAVQPARATVLSTPEQILHPDRYPVPAGAIFAEEVATGYYKALR